MKTFIYVLFNNLDVIDNQLIQYYLLDKSHRSELFNKKDNYEYPIFHLNLYYL